MSVRHLDCLLEPRRIAVIGASNRPEVPDLALICTPPATVPGLIEKLGRSARARRS